MKCTNRKYYRRKNRKRQLTIRLCSEFALIIILALGGFYLLKSRDIVLACEEATYAKSIYKSDLFSDNLCVTNEEVEFEDFYTNDEFPGALLFNLDTKEILFAEHVHEKLYPASTTKIMTTYVALKHGNLSDTVTVSENAVSVPSDSSVAGLRKGDRLTLEDLLYSLMLPSGNDSAVAIAEHIAGSVEGFAELMNKEAIALGATNSHFVNAHGYHDDDHYTTAYDLYLILNACVQNETFVDIISSKYRSAIVSNTNGTSREMTWNQSNRFINGARQVPKGITVLGGKTGTTYEAGYCLALYGTDANKTPYIGIIMGATSSRNLYDNMTFLWAAIPD